MFLIALLLVAGAVDSCNIVKKGVTEEDKATILDMLNKYRNYVASGQETQAGGLPKAANMMQLVWDDKAASVAQAWAEKCTFRIDLTTLWKVRQGQNIGRDYDSFEEFINGMNTEVKRFSQSEISNFQNGDRVGHFTQNIWATTAKVGCGFVAYEKKNGSEANYYVCNYSPPGNWIGFTIYTPGQPCSQCPRGTTCSTTYTSLCTR